ncbi:Rv1733c family protein [Streptomyces sp. NPDC001102]
MAAVRHAGPARTRWWRLRHNPLRRPSYLVEGWLLLAVWTLALLAAVAAGLGTAGAVERDGAALRAARHPVQAVLTKDAESGTPSVDGIGDAHAWATVRWTAADGTRRTGVTRVAAASRAGSTTRIWLDAQDRLVPEPAGVGQARFQAVVLGALAGVTVAGGMLLAGSGMCALLDRRRLLQWDAEWARADRQWGGKTR